MRLFRIEKLKRLFRRAGAPAGGGAAPWDDGDALPGAEAGLHGFVRASDQWFSRQLSALEQYAIEQGAAWADAGLPRHSVEDEALEVEIALEKRASELFRRWATRIRDGVEDAVHDALRTAGHEILSFRSHLSELRRALSERAEVERSLERIRAERRESEISFGYGRMLPRPWFWVLIVLLMIVDLVANIPIFQELVPREEGAELHWQELSARAERYGIWAGLYRVGARLLFAPDITLLALGVIAFLVFSAHAFGEALRARLALREEELPAARVGIRSHRRQWLLPAVIGALATLLVITFLFVSRVIVEENAKVRHQEAMAEVAALETRLAAAREANDIAAIASIEPQLPTARAVLADRERRLQYASGIRAMNLPILLLNLVLALAAALASYLAQETRVTDGRREDPLELATLARLNALDERAAAAREAIREASREAHAALARAKRLLDSRPLRGWEAKAERLRGVVPLFRAENARRRGIDPANILAFRREPARHLPDFDPEAPLPVPEVMERHHAELAALHGELAILDAPLSRDVERAARAATARTPLEPAGGAEPGEGEA